MKQCAILRLAGEGFLTFSGAPTWYRIIDSLTKHRGPKMILRKQQNDTLMGRKQYSCSSCHTGASERVANPGEAECSIFAGKKLLRVELDRKRSVIQLLAISEV